MKNEHDGRSYHTDTLPEPAEGVSTAQSVPVAQPPASAAMDDAEYAMHLLMALTSMSSRSKRRQADLVAALRGAHLPAEPRKVRAALRLLQAQGAIENLVPLSDGGLLLSVTQAATSQFGGLSQWLLPDDLAGG